MKLPMERTSDSLRILIVCTGNICRSAMAEGILRRIVEESGRSDIAVSSAGTMAAEGYRASTGAVETALARGIDLGTHRARLLTRDLLAGSDLVLVMETSHLYEAARVTPEARGKIFLLSQFGRDALPDDAEPFDVADPLGGSQEIYAACYVEIEAHLRRAMPEIVRMAEEKKRSSGDSPAPRPA